MLRFRDIKDAAAASAYYKTSDSSKYYLDDMDLRREVGGKAAKLLGLGTTPDFEQFKRLLEGLDPHTGEQLTAKLRDGRLAGWDITASIPKSVTIALEAGDTRIHDVLWEAGREAMADIGKLVTTRIRKGGANDEKQTGNMLWYGWEHPETRPSRQDNMPDPDRHIHFVIPNVTWDAEEEQWKAIRFRPIMDLRKYFDRSFDLRLSSKLANLGYEIETRHKDGKHYSWDIKHIPPSAIQKFSRRTQEVEQLADDLGVTNAVSKDKLGATSRQFKRKDMTLADYREYWQSRITPEEHAKIGNAIKDAVERGSLAPNADVGQKAVQFSLLHHFERQSVVPVHDLAITAMERSMGSGVMPEDIEPEMRRQGLLTKDGEATTHEVLAEESRMIAFARDGRGTMRRMGQRPTTQSSPPGVSSATVTPEQQALCTPDKNSPAHVSIKVGSTDIQLSAEQAAVANHVWSSQDRVTLIRGGAGTGKTFMMKAAIAGIDQPVIVLAPSAQASRDVLRKEGFAGADTVAKFLQDKEFQEKARKGVIWIDEAGLLGVRDMAKVFSLADRLAARIVLQGDSRQHQAVARGTPFRVLQEFAELPCAELRDIRRQKGDYKQAVDSIQKGDILQGYDKLASLEWVHQVESNEPLIDEYMKGLGTKKSMLIIAPTHREADEITADLRARLKTEGVLRDDEQAFATLRPLNWTEAERGDLTRYDGTEIVQFHRNSGAFRAGEKAGVGDLESPGKPIRPEHFSVYAPSALALAAGDSIRITANGRDKSGKHRLNNGNIYRVRGFTKDGEITLSNGWVLPKNFGHLTHGYVSTSHASQGKTVDRTLIAMGGESLGAMNAAQFYVSASRGRESAQIFTDLSTERLREAIQRSDRRKAAVEMMGLPAKEPMPAPRPTWRSRAKQVMAHVITAYRQLQDKATRVIENLSPERDGYGYTR